MMAVRYQIYCNDKLAYSEISVVGACTRAKESSKGSPEITVTVKRVEDGKPDVLEARYLTVNGKTKAWIR